MPYRVENNLYRDHFCKYNLTCLYLKNLEFFVCVVNDPHALYFLTIGSTKYISDIDLSPANKNLLIMLLPLKQNIKTKIKQSIITKYLTQVFLIKKF